MATYTKYEPFIEHLCNKEIDAFGSTDTWKVVIHTDAPTVATDEKLTDLTQLTGTQGYNTGGENITFNSTRSGATVTATSVDVVWTASGGNLGNSTAGRYFTYYDDTSTSDYLAAYWDYASTFTVAAGETMTLDFGASLWTIT